jgi:dTDP-4-amino-4,6-dideoxygalactose transaminase
MIIFAFLCLRDALADIDGLEFRAEADQGRDAGDALIFFLPDKIKRRRLTDSLQEAGVGFKLLPGALKWHFAGHWDHIWKNLAGFPAGDPLEMWPRSRDLLDRAAALPIMIKMTPEQIDRTAQAVRQGMAGL